MLDELFLLCRLLKGKPNDIFKSLKGHGERPYTGLKGRADPMLPLQTDRLLINPSMKTTAVCQAFLLVLQFIIPSA